MPVSSQYPTINLPELDIYSFLFNRQNRPFPANNIIYQDADDSSRKYTYTDAVKLSLQFGQALQSHYSIRKGDVIALFTPNDIDYPVVTFGTLWTGAIVSPANPGYTVPELTYQLRDSTAKLVIAHWSAIDTVRKACQELGIPTSRILILGAQHDPTGELKHWTSLKPSASATKSTTPAKISAKDDLAFLVYSSGTTGRPKGVMLTHHNVISNVCQITACEAGKLSHDGRRRTPGIPDAPPTGDRILACLPFFHIYGLTSLVLTPMYNGLHTVVLAKFGIEKFCSLVQEHKITFIYIVPPMALLLAKHECVPKYDLSTIRITNSGAAPLTKELQEAVFKRCRIRIKQGYGLSETSPTTHEQRWEDWDKKIGTIGKLQPNMQAKFCAVGAEDEVRGGPPKELKAGETGELYVKGPNVFKGYWRNERATKECLDEEGWFRTGDVGHVDEDGDFFITDRVKELIKYKGFQVPPAELEGYLIDHELVDDVAVVGVVSEEMGTEIPRAYVVRKGGMKAVQKGDDKTIINWMNAKVANHKKLRGGIKFVDAVPKSASGKLLRRLLKDQARKEFEEEEKQKLKAKL
ncbi:hypothetical protein H2198_009186 [Neophaeococcomyces mojaviensis]|uniref:Uncharacterized protein n=1 Tax=Neophaeococcomyces mojaviensis TaxID=3383035 RepID=A0ACC2ZV74_9EURO|nr:hypothetical protein H2198_009186 [Knufia sp. JES_112]